MRYRWSLSSCRSSWARDLPTLSVSLIRCVSKHEFSGPFRPPNCVLHARQVVLFVKWEHFVNTARNKLCSRRWIMLHPSVQYDYPMSSGSLILLVKWQIKEAKTLKCEHRLLSLQTLLHRRYKFCLGFVTSRWVSPNYLINLCVNSGILEKLRPLIEC